MEYLILAEAGDELALGVAARLRRALGTPAVGVISPELLALAPRLVYRQVPGELPGALDIEYEIELASGACLKTGQPRIVFNRLRSPDPPQFRFGAPTDRQYASAELGALWVSWLAALRYQGVLVVNPPARGALQPSYSRLEWLKLAAQAGLPIVQASLGELETAHPQWKPCQRWLAVGSRLALLPGASAQQTGEQINSAPDQTGELPTGLRRLQALSRCPLIEVTLEDGLVHSVNPFPTSTHPAAVETIAQVFLEAAL